MISEKKTTFELVNSEGDYLIFRTREEAETIKKEYDRYAEKGCEYFIRNGSRMTDEELKNLPELENF